MPKILLILAAIAWAGGAISADQPRYGPPPSWVEPLPIPTRSAAPEGNAVQVLLLDSQTRFGPEGDEFYVESAVRILSPQGLAAAGNIGDAWNPDTDTLAIHKLHIVRGDKVIDLLAGGKKFTVIRRETNLELAMLDGTLTATLQPEDLRVGDIVDWALTLTKRDPVRQGYSEGGPRIPPGRIIGRTRFRVVWPLAKAMRWKAHEGLGTPAMTTLGARRQMVFDLADTEAPKPPRLAPPRFNHLGELEITQFSDWAAVSTLMAPLYAKAETLAADSPLKAEIEKIKATAADPKSRAEAALHLAQQQVRYLYLGMNNGGLVPAGADVTWKRRFGDCKGKTALLVTLLQALGVDARPALVSTTGGDGLDERLPRLDLFDHVFVRANIGDKTYWLDGARSGDQRLDDIPAPVYRWALPVQAAGAMLERIDQPPLNEPRLEATVHIDAKNGVDTPAPSHIDRILRGDDAIGFHQALDALSPGERDRQLRELWTGLYPWIAVSQVGAVYDPAKNEMRLAMDGAATMDWGDKTGARQFDIGESSLGWDASLKREPGPEEDAPFSVNHPVYAKRSVTITLPRGQTFQLIGGRDVDETMAGIVFHRRSRLEGGMVTMESSERSLVPEFPASDASTAETALRTLARSDVLVAIDSQPSVTGPAPEDDTAPAPTDAAGLSVRGAQFLAAGKFDQAIADFAAAARLEPMVGKHVYNRGVAHFENGEDAAALADFDHALRLNPGDPLPAMARGQLFLVRGDRAAARKAFDAIIARSPGNPDLLGKTAEAFSFAKDFDTAIAYYDRLISQFPTDQRFAQILNARCWTRAISGRMLESGLADCEAALKLKPDAPDILDSKGLVELRLGRLDKAVADYDLALGQRPGSAPSLFGRGVAKRLKGLKAEGDADITAATASDAKIADQFAGYGVKP